MSESVRPEDCETSPECLLQHSPDAVLLVNHEGLILEVNEHALALFGYSAGELIGQPVELLVPDSMRAAHHAKRRDYALAPHLRTMGSGLSVTGRRSDGGEVPLDVMLSPRRSGEDRVVVVVIRDVSHIHELQRKAAEQTERLLRLNEAKNHLLGMAAHDLRNPLTVIRGYSELLEDGVIGVLNEQQRQVVQHIQRSSEYMAELVNDLLDYTALESGRLQLRRQPIDIAALAEEVVILERSVASKKGSVVALDAETALPALEVDPHKLRQVMHNLISNAVKYAPPKETAQVRVFSEDRWLAFAVEDRGPGLTDDDQVGLFEPFHRARSRPTAGESSTGLGLAIARKIMRAHGGTLSVRSALGRGSTFIARLPFPIGG